MYKIIDSTESKLLTWKAYWVEEVIRDIPFGFSRKCVVEDGEETIFPDAWGESCMPHLTRNQLLNLRPARIDWSNIRTNNALRDISFNFLNNSCSLSMHHNSNIPDYKIDFSICNHDFSIHDSNATVEVNGDNIAKKVFRKDAIVEMIEKPNLEDNTKINKTCVVQIVKPSKKINHTFVIREDNGITQIIYYSRRGKKVPFYNDGILPCAEEPEFKEIVNTFLTFLKNTAEIHDASLENFNTSEFIATLSQGIGEVVSRVKDESPIEYLVETLNYYQEMQQRTYGKKTYSKSKHMH